MKKNTSFGSMQTLMERDGQIISEYLEFEREGRGHSHERWEICHVTAGSGVIVNGEERIEVSKGSMCKIPPHTEHWMIPDPTMEVLLVYSDTEG
ncbi:MAG: cupin domain-containing protein [Flavobacteriales bacterium]|nr:cupin domain-containing protein [Flavobacteriales bacterium]